MDWIEILSWMAAAIFLAVLHLSAPKRAVEHPFRVLGSAVVGALVGGNLAFLLSVSTAHGDRLGIVALVVAAIVAEIGVLTTIAIDRGRRPLTHSR